MRSAVMSVTVVVFSCFALYSFVKVEVRELNDFSRLAVETKVETGVLAPEWFACSCNDLNFAVNQISNTIEGCCFSIDFSNNGNNCFNKLTIQFNSAQFVSAMANPGYTFTQPTNTSLEITHSSGTIPAGNNQAGKLCLKPTSQFFAITISYNYNDNGVIKTCTRTIETRCMAGRCDSINPFIELLRMNPPRCCYRFIDNNVPPNTFQSISLSLSSGVFTGLVTNTSQGYSASHSGGFIQYTHNSNFIPGGLIDPGAFCISGQQNPFSVTIKYFTSGGGVADSCKFDLVNSCAFGPMTDSLCRGELCNPPNTQWTQIIPSAQYIIYDMAVYNGKLFLAGVFNGIGTQANAKNIASWDGTNWSTLGTGPNNGTNGIIYDLVVHNNKLFIGGSFNLAGGAACNNLVFWDDFTGNFGTLGNPPNDGVSGGNQPVVKSLLSYGLDLMVGGRFTKAGGAINSGNIHLWNDAFQSWSLSNFNGGLSGGMVNALQVYNGAIIAGGSFQNPVQGIGRWNGNNWTQLGGGIPTSMANLDGVAAMEVFNGKLCVGGNFSGANVPNTKNLAAWDGSNWSDIDLGVNTGFEITDLLVYNNELFYGGTPNITLGNPLFTNGVGRLINNAWTNTNHQTKLVYCLEVYDPPGAAGPCQIFAAGELFFDKLGCTTTAIKEAEDRITYTIFPNPASSHLIITGIKSPVQLEIYDLLGKKLPVIYHYSGASQTVEANLQNLSSGAYIIVIKNPQGYYLKTTRFIKN